MLLGLTRRCCSVREFILVRSLGRHSTCWQGLHTDFCVACIGQLRCIKNNLFFLALLYKQDDILLLNVLSLRRQLRARAPHWRLNGSARIVSGVTHR